MQKEDLCVVFEGRISGQKDIAAVKAAFMAKLHIPAEKIDHVFSGARVVLKKRLNLEKALKMQGILAQMGAFSSIEPQKTPPADQTPGPSTLPFQCPKCGRTAPPDDPSVRRGECPGCGVVVQKYLQGHCRS